MRVASEKERGPGDAPSGWDDRELLLRMRRDEAAALGEFYRRFAPLLSRWARHFDVQRALCKEVAFDCLTDAALHLMQPATPLPRNLRGYLVKALRFRVLNERRSGRRWSVVRESAVSDAVSGERVVTGTCSEGSFRASAGPSAEPGGRSPAVARLIRMVKDGASEEEEQILTWVGDGVPQTLIAEWLGMTYNAIRVRVHRLRDRLREASLQLEAGLAGRERVEVHEFLQRLGVREPMVFGSSQPGHAAGDSQRGARDRSRDDRMRLDEEVDG